MRTTPDHLKKYIVDQDYHRYTPIDHATWRFILRQLRDYLSTHAHPFYLEGLEKTGIEIEKIPSIKTISDKLEAFGWCARPVSGFIPPAAFMELQAHAILPIASDMRSVDHLLYTPAPDIVHEAAGHAPMLAHPEYAEYLKKYAQVAKKAIISKEDLDLYEAIRELSDIKESPSSTPAEIKAAEEKLDHVSNGMSHISEATLLGRMNWWTAEYGLIGDLKSPKILGAGILSSVGEAKNCLSDRVKKLPLTVDCVDYSYDITEQQPQLFVTPDFAHLSVVLEQLAERMAFRIGGSEGLNRAIQAKSINTVQFDSGLQISGVLAETIEANGGLAYLRFQGRSQLCFSDQQLQGHGPDYHSQGYSTPVGNLKNFKNVCPSELSDSQWKELGLTIGADAEIEFTSGVKVKGRLTSKLQKNGKTLLLSFENCLVKYQDRVLFEPSWGTFDMALGCTIPSVFGGPADRIAFGETDDFVAARVPQRKWTDKEILLHSLYQRIRDQREKKIKGADLSSTLKEVSAVLDTEFPAEWLLKMEIYELCDLASEPVLKENTLNFLYDLKTKTPELASTIDDGLRLAKHL